MELLSAFNSGVTIQVKINNVGFEKAQLLVYQNKGNVLYAHIRYYDGEQYNGEFKIYQNGAYSYESSLLGANDVVIATGQMTNDQKAQTRTNLGVVSTATLGNIYTRLDALEGTTVTVEGTTPTITPAANTIYECGELTSLTISNPPATGKYSIIFYSGVAPTATVGIENFVAEANKRYRITVEDNYATYDSWPYTPQ